MRLRYMNIYAMFTTYGTITDSLEILNHLRSANYSGDIAATARFFDEEQPLKDAGADIVFNVYALAGESYIEHVLQVSDNEMIQSV